MIAACNTVNVVKKNKGAITSQNHSYISALRQFSDQKLTKQERQLTHTDTENHWQHNCSWQGMCIQIQTCCGVTATPWKSRILTVQIWSELNLSGFISILNDPPQFLFPRITIFGLCYQQHGKMTVKATLGFFVVLLSCWRKCWILITIERFGLED